LTLIHKETYKLKSLTILIAGLTLALAPIAVRADDTPAQVQSLMDKQSSSIVTVDIVIKTQVKMAGQAQDSESRMEMQGTVVSPDGLILLSDAPFDTKSMMDMMGMSAAGLDLGIKITPTDFKVVVGNEDKQYTAFLAGTDPDLGLAFIKLEDLGDRALQPVDFTSTATPDIGEKVYSLTRLGKGYDYAPVLDAGWVFGQITKPQTAWVVSGAGSIGLPVYTVDGVPLGLVATVPSGVKDTSSSGSAMGMGMFMRMFGGGGTSGDTSTFLIPSSVITTVITRAKEQAVTVAAKLAAAKSATTPTTSTTPTTPAKPAPPAPPAAPGAPPVTK